MKRRGIVFHGDLKNQLDTDDSPVKSVPRPELGNLSGICKELFPEFHAAKIVSPKYGAFMVAYSASSGIREGDLVAISINNGIPVAVRTIRFGFTPEKILLLNLDPKEDESHLSVLKTSDVPWDEDLAEQIGMEPVAIKSLSGEKIHNVGLNGMKIGHGILSLFSSVRTKISLSPDVIAMISSGFRFITKSGSIVSRYKDEKGYMSQTTLKKTDDGLLGIMHSINGDVDFGLKSLNISNLMIPGLKVDISKFISIRLVLDFDVKKYKLKTSIVTHSYKNRSLDIEGNSSSGRNIHSELKKVISINGDLEKYSCGLGTIDKKTRPVTFFEGISLNGDVFTFSAGKTTSVKTDSSDISLGNINVIELGEKTIKTQATEMSVQFPVSTNSAKTSIFYGTRTNIQYGDEVNLNYRGVNSVKINTKTEYDIDNESGIETKEELISPVRVISSTKEICTFQPNENIDTPCEKTVILSGESEDRFSLKPDGAGLSYTSTFKGKLASLAVGISKAGISTSGSFVLGSKSSVFDTERSTFTGKAQFNNGVSALRTFTVNANNIQLLSKGNLILQGETIGMRSLSSIAIQYHRRMSFMSDFAPIVNKKPTQASMVIFGSNSIGIQSENVNIQGVQSVSATAEVSASFGAKRTSISGLGEQ